MSHHSRFVSRATVSSVALAIPALLSIGIVSTSHGQSVTPVPAVAQKPLTAADAMPAIHACGTGTLGGPYAIRKSKPDGAGNQPIGDPDGLGNQPVGDPDGKGNTRVGTPDGWGNQPIGNPDSASGPHRLLKIFRTARDRPDLGISDVATVRSKVDYSIRFCVVNRGGKVAPAPISVIAKSPGFTLLEKTVFVPLQPGERICFGNKMRNAPFPGGLSSRLDGLVIATTTAPDETSTLDNACAVQWTAQ